jgi:hypothetical protein
VLLRLADADHAALLTLHHIAGDGWSMGVLARELVVLYAAFCRGQPSPLPELAVQYADYALWQRHWLQGERLQRQVDYWKQRLAGLLPLDLPTDRPRPAVRSLEGDHLAFALPSHLSEELRRLARQEGATLFMTLLAAFQILLARYSDREDVAVGAPVAGRNRPELESLIGFFVNTVVLRTDLSGEPAFRELLARVKETCQGAYAHQDLPFEKLVEELRPSRDLSRQPLFQVMFVSHDVPLPTFQIPGLTLIHVPGDAVSFRGLLGLGAAVDEGEQLAGGTLEVAEAVAHRHLHIGDRVEQPVVRRPPPQLLLDSGEEQACFLTYEPSAIPASAQAEGVLPSEGSLTHPCRCCRKSRAAKRPRAGGRRCRSRSGTTGPGSPRSSGGRRWSRSSRPRRGGPAWAWPSPGASSRRTAAASLSTAAPAARKSP